MNSAIIFDINTKLYSKNYMDIMNDEISFRNAFHLYTSRLNAHIFDMCRWSSYEYNLQCINKLLESYRKLIIESSNNKINSELTMLSNSKNEYYFYIGLPASIVVYERDKFHASHLKFILLHIKEFLAFFNYTYTSEIDKITICYRFSPSGSTTRYNQEVKRVTIKQNKIPTIPSRMRGDTIILFT